MYKRNALWFCVIVFFSLLCPSDVLSQRFIDRSSLRQAEMNFSAAKQSEQRGDSENAMRNYMNALSMVQMASTDPKFLQTATVGGMKVGDLGRHIISSTLDLLDKSLSGDSSVAMAPRNLIDQLQNLYGRMQAIEPSNATWYYLDATAYAANQDYRAGYLKLQECLHCSQIEPATKQKALALMAHIKPGYEQQQQMYIADRRAYAEYVNSGKQALDNAIAISSTNASLNRQRGNYNAAARDYARAEQLRRQRMNLGR